MYKFKWLVICFLVALLAGCATQTIPDPDPADSTYDDSSSADTGSMGSGSGMGEGEFFDEGLSGGELTNIIYFDFDSSELRPEDTDIVSRHAMQLSSNPQARVRLEGHADERGSREYNIGLGERRAQSVRRMLMIQGASAAQIATVSFGEERPVELGSDEDSWAQNRRVEIKYTN